MRFQMIRWSAILACIALPTLAWFISADVIELQRVNAIGVTLAAMLLALIVLKRVSDYLMDEFMRSYMDADNWDYLSARFGVAKPPLEYKDARGLKGVGALDRDDVVFAMDINVSGAGVYVNTLPFGRLVVPWESIQMLRHRRLLTDRGPQETVSVILDGPDSSLCIPWDGELDSLVPKSVGVS